MRSFIRQIKSTGLLLGGLFFCMLSLHAKGYIPTTKWPYWYDEFQKGTVFFSDNRQSKEEFLNIHLLHGSLHYVDGDHIKQSDPRHIKQIVMAADTFLYLEGELAQLVKRKGSACLFKQIRIDKESLEASPTGAYGMNTSAAATQQLTSLQMNGMSNLNHTQMKLEKQGGKELRLIQTYYLLVGGEPVRATRKNLEQSLSGAETTSFRSFIKQNKIKWKEEASLIKLLDFFDK